MNFFSIKKGFAEIKITIFDKEFLISRHCDEKVHKAYLSRIKELKKKFGNEKIKVGFLVNEQAKWQYQSLYDELEKHADFEPIVLVTKLYSAHKRRNKKNFYKSIDDCYQFFAKKQMNVRYAYDNEKQQFVHVKDFGVDLLFYPQQWENAPEQHPATASDYVLTYYSPYGLDLLDFDGIYLEEFHRLLWRMYVEDQWIISHLSELTQREVTNCAIVGYPKLDSYFSSESTNIKTEKPIIIYAPHHSFEDDGLRCATFQHNGHEILKLAQRYKEQIFWIFKPHPRFKSAVISNEIMSEQEVNDYYQEWEKLGMVYDDGNYIGLFKQSAGMITDCASFLGEYLPSEKPLFHLDSGFVPFNDFAKMFLSTYYKVKGADDLEEILQRVVLKQQDEQKKNRLSKISLLFDKTEKSADKIIKDIIRTIGPDKS